MCYDISYLTKRQTDYAKRYGKKEDVEDIQQRIPATYHTNGFQHGKVPILYGEDRKLDAFSWGLIPFWAKSSKDAMEISNKTLNARGESIFEKPSFRGSATSKRCLVLVDGFFENHHKNGKNFPFYIQRKDEQPFTLGGLYDEWEDSETGAVKHTFSIITTDANERMSFIHNNPKVLERGGPRMPFIVPYGLESAWLKNDLDKNDVLEMIKPFQEGELKDHPVASLRGKKALGNNPEVQNKMNYPELTGEQQRLF